MRCRKDRSAGESREGEIMYTRILIPLDGSKIAEKALPYARTLAGKLRIPVELLTIIDTGAVTRQNSAEEARHVDAITEDGVQSSLEYLNEVAKTFPGCNVKCVVEKGRADEVIIKKGEADPRSLITMTTHGRSGINLWLLGNVAEKVFRGTTNALLLIRATDEAKTEGEAVLKSMVVPLDHSGLAESILPRVAGLAKKLNLPVVYLENKTKELEKLEVETVFCVTKEGLSADESAALGRASSHSLIAMTTHARAAVSRWVLESVTEKVVRYSGDPVLVARAT
jgi:nucleotide-binding universal stress UspA family protein